VNSRKWEGKQKWLLCGLQVGKNSGLASWQLAEIPIMKKEPAPPAEEAPAEEAQPSA